MATAVTNLTAAQVVCRQEDLVRDYSFPQQQQKDEEEGKTASSSWLYHLRGLQHLDELEPWAKFCASVFSYKPNPPPPSYFTRHYYNDPDRHGVELIRVAVCGNSNEIVATCRIFCRTIATLTPGKTVLAVGGIGEVCTHMDHRKRGLSKELLQDAFAIMKSQTTMQASLLHAAPAFFPFYQSVGYQNTESQWRLITINASVLHQEEQSVMATTYPDTVIRLARFPDDAVRLMKLHQIYSEQRFAGCIIRSLEYWNDYVSHELEDSLWVLEELPRVDKTETKILGWLSIRPRPVDSGELAKYQLREFGCDLSCANAYMVLVRLLATVMSNMRETEHSNDSSFRLLVPAGVFEDVQAGYQLLDDSGSASCMDFETVVSENDFGWMYKSLSKDDDDSRIPILDSTGEKQPRVHHLIWPTDSF